MADRRGAAGAFTALIAIVCLWPYLWVLPLGPMSRDAAIWMARSRVFKQVFIEWIFFTQHFKVGYRPVTGLSYAMNDLVGGYRVTDLLLHASCVVLVYVLYRRLAPMLPKAGGVVAAALMAGHPIAELVVPHLARRGYPLATALSLGGLALLTLPGKARLIGPLLLGAAALSNDASYVVFVVGALLVWSRDRDRDSLTVLGGVLLTLLVERFVVIGGVGGYHVDDRAARMVPILTATWDRLLGFTGPLELPLTVGAASAAMLGLLMLGAATASGLREAWGKPAGLMLAWLVGFTLLFTPQGVWFPRQTYLMVAPLALLVGMLVAQVQRERWQSMLAAVPAALILAACLVRSPVLHGTNEVQRQAWEQTEHLVQETAAAVSTLRPKQPVHLVLPFYKRPGQAGFRARDARDDDDQEAKKDPLGARIVEQRVQQMTGRLKNLTTYALLFTDPAAPAPYATLSREAEGWILTAPPSTRVSVLVGETLLEDASGTRARVDFAPGHIFLFDGVEGRLLPVQ